VVRAGHWPPHMSGEHDLSRRTTSLSPPATNPLDEPARPVALSFRGVTHRYGSRVALDELDFKVSSGEVLALLGPNGAGKSTTISALLGLVRPQQGQVEVLGSDPRRAVADGRVGAMLQSGSGIGLPPGVRVDQALALVRRLYPRPAPRDEIVERADIGAFMRRNMSCTRVAWRPWRAANFACADAASSRRCTARPPANSPRPRDGDRLEISVAGRQPIWKYRCQLYQSKREIYAG